MVLLIDTTDEHLLTVGLLDGNKIRRTLRVSARYAHGEKIIPTLQKLLSKEKVSLRMIRAIACVNAPAPFSALRVGIATANAIAWSLGIPVIEINTSGEGLERRIQETLKKVKQKKAHLIAPRYGREPNITIKK